MKWKREDITPEILRELLDYDPETGILTWKERDRRWFPTGSAHAAWNGKHQGKAALTYISRGYRTGSVLNNSFKAHRVAWAIKTGEFPPDRVDIDHVDGDRSNNIWTNLRLATRSQNLANTQPRHNSTSKYKGVNFQTAHQKWVAEIRPLGIRKVLGYFDCEKVAAQAYDAAAVEAWGDYARLNFPEAT